MPVKLLHVGKKYNRIITIDLDKAIKAPTRLGYGERTLIFAKSVCPRCGGPVTRFQIAKRRAFRCDTCQAPPPVANSRPPLKNLLQFTQYARKGLGTMKRLDSKICVVCNRPMTLASEMGKNLDRCQILQRTPVGGKARQPPRKKQRKT